MLSSGFDNAPISRFLALSVVASSIVASITDSRHLFPIWSLTDLWPRTQLWKVFTWQLCFTSMTEMLFATVTLYHLRVIERLWSTRKLRSFILSTLPYTTVVPPLLLLVLRPLTFGRVHYLPSGPTALIFALLAQYHVMIPRTYTYRLASGDPTPNSSSSPRPYSPVEKSITYTDKTLTYLVASQLALSQLPGSALSAAVGWAVGYAWRNELLPGWTTRRVPAETNPIRRSSISRSNAFVNGSAEGTTTRSRPEAESLHGGTSLRTSSMQAESSSRSM